MKPPRRIPVTATLLAAILVGCSGYNNITPPPSYRISPEVSFEGRHVVIFMVDAFGKDAFDRMLGAGRLPFIKRYLVDRGTVCGPNHPTLTANTLAAFTSAMTGAFAAHAGIPANTFFDRRTLSVRRYDTPSLMRFVSRDATVPCLYEYLDGDFTAQVLSQVNRGVTRFFENYTSAGPAYYFENYLFVDRLTTARFYSILEEAAARKTFPRVASLYYMSADGCGHKFGPDSPQYERALEQIDIQVGEVCGVLAENGRLDDVLLVLYSDHGMVSAEPGQGIDIAELLRALGIAATDGERFDDEFTKPEKRKTFYNQFCAVAAATGNNTCMVYLRKPAGSSDAASASWDSPCDADSLRAYPTADGSRVNLLTAFAAQSAVGWVTWREDENTVGVMNETGESCVRRTLVEGQRRYAYEVIRGDDPLGYARHADERLAKMLEGGSYNSIEWLDVLADTAHPDVVAQLPELFDSWRTGDIVLFARPEWSFLPHYPGNHGGITRTELQVPLLIAGPGSENISPGPCRNVDIVPTLLDYLGKKAPEGETWTFDGRSLLRQNDQ